MSAEEGLREEMKEALLGGKMDQFNFLCQVLGDILAERGDPEEKWCRVRWEKLPREVYVDKEVMDLITIPAMGCLEEDHGQSWENSEQILCFDPGRFCRNGVTVRKVYHRFWTWDHNLIWEEDHQNPRDLTSLYEVSR